MWFTGGAHIWRLIGNHYSFFCLFDFFWRFIYFLRALVFCLPECMSVRRYQSHWNWSYRQLWEAIYMGAGNWIPVLQKSSWCSYHRFTSPAQKSFFPMHHHMRSRIQFSALCVNGVRQNLRLKSDFSGFFFKFIYLSYPTSGPQLSLPLVLPVPSQYPPLWSMKSFKRLAKVWTSPLVIGLDNSFLRCSLDRPSSLGPHIDSPTPWLASSPSFA